MRFLRILLFFEGVFLVECSVKNRKGELTEIKEENCPDSELQEECDSLCRVEYNQCRLLCETELCQSLCSEEYQGQFSVKSLIFEIDEFFFFKAAVTIAHVERTASRVV